MVAMRGVMIPILFSLLLVSGLSPGIWQDPPTPTPAISLSSPQPGQVLQGSIPVTLNTALNEIANLELSFAYLNDPTETWFLIYQSSQTSVSNTITTWDTTSISDGNYNLSLMIQYSDGSQEIVLIPGLRVRNYSPIETDTPAPPTVTSTPLATGEPSSTPTEMVTPSPELSATPAVSPDTVGLTMIEVLRSLWQGVLAAVALFVIFGIYRFLRTLFRSG